MSITEGAALLELQILAPLELFQTIRQLIRRRLIASMCWQEGQFELTAGKIENPDIGPLRWDLPPLIQQALTTHWTVDRFLETLSPRLILFPRPGPGFVNAVKRLDLNAAHTALFCGLERTRPLSDALGENLNSPAVLAALWVLDELGALEFSQEPLEDPSDREPGFGTEIELSPLETADGPEPHTTPSARSDHEDDRQAELLHAEIQQLLSPQNAPDHYQLLGVTPEAKTGTIKKAYLKAAKRYHPDALTRLGLQEIKSEASEVFSRVSQAFEILSNAKARQAYDAEQRGDLSEATAQLLSQAETTYRKGEILLRMGDFKGSLPYLESAVEIWPDEGVYQRALGWALYKQSASDPKAAREHLGRAIELTPRDPVAHFQLGMVLRALGESKSAQSLLDRAKELEPQPE
jgi:curved DNA-binding protein CbpA